MTPPSQCQHLYDSIICLWLIANKLAMLLTLLFETKFFHLGLCTLWCMFLFRLLRAGASIL